MLSHIWMNVGDKLLYEELQIKFDFRHGRPTFFLSYCPLSDSLMDPYFNLFGVGGDLYCFSNTLSMLINIIFKIYNFFLLLGNEFQILKNMSNFLHQKIIFYYQELILLL